jgi:hypothetical protein
MDKFWNCPKCERLNIGGWCACGWRVGTKKEEAGE